MIRHMSDEQRHEEVVTKLDAILLTTDIMLRFPTRADLLKAMAKPDLDYQRVRRRAMTKAWQAINSEKRIDDFILPIWEREPNYRMDMDRKGPPWGLIHIAGKTTLTKKNVWSLTVELVNIYQCPFYKHVTHVTKDAPRATTETIDGDEECLRDPEHAFWDFQTPGQSVNYGLRWLDV